MCVAARVFGRFFGWEGLVFGLFRLASLPPRLWKYLATPLEEKETKALCLTGPRSAAVPRLPENQPLAAGQGWREGAAAGAQVTAVRISAGGPHRTRGQFLRVISTKERVPRRRSGGGLGAGPELGSHRAAGLFPSRAPVSPGVPHRHLNTRTVDGAKT